MKACPFCNLSKEFLFAEDRLCDVFEDANPVSKGHLLGIPKRHFLSFFDATNEEVLSVYGLLKKCQKILKDN